MGKWRWEGQQDIGAGQWEHMQMRKCFLPSWRLGTVFSEQGILDLGSESKVCHAGEKRKVEEMKCTETQWRPGTFGELLVEAWYRQSLRDKGEGGRQVCMGRQEGGWIVTKKHRLHHVSLARLGHYYSEKTVEKEKMRIPVGAVIQTPQLGWDVYL